MLLIKYIKHEKFNDKNFAYEQLEIVEGYYLLKKLIKALYLLAK